MPTPNKNESEKDFVARCIPIVSDEHPEWKQNQRVAVCFSIYSEHQKKQKLKEKIGTFKEKCKE